MQLYAGAGEGIGRAGNFMTPEKFTDTDAERLAACTEIRLLVLADTNLTDVGLHYFQSMHKLQRLYVQGTHVTKAGIDDLHGALPNTRIFFGDDDVEVVGPSERQLARIQAQSGL